MNALFESLGYVFGSLLWFAYGLVKNFAIAILIFTVILRALQFPLQIKSQKSMAGTMRLHKKQQEIQEKYGKNAMLKGMNFLEGGTTIERNGQIGGHKAE